MREGLTLAAHCSVIFYILTKFSKINPIWPRVNFPVFCQSNDFDRLHQASESCIKLILLKPQTAIEDEGGTYSYSLLQCTLLQGGCKSQNSKMLFLAQNHLTWSCKSCLSPKMWMVALSSLKNWRCLRGVFIWYVQGVSPQSALFTLSMVMIPLISKVYNINYIIQK